MRIVSETKKVHVAALRRISVNQSINNNNSKECIMNSPTPAESGGGVERRATPDAAAAAGNGPKLFDSIERYVDKPIFHDALLKVKYKIEHGTLSNRYDIVYRSDDHKSVLLNLPGEIKLR